MPPQFVHIKIWNPDDVIRECAMGAHLSHTVSSALLFQASDAVTRGIHKGWILAQKGAWAVKQMQLESELASSGMQQGMQVECEEGVPACDAYNVH